MNKLAQFAVSDKDGYNVFFTDDLDEAIDEVNALDGDYEIDDEDGEARAAIMQLNEEGNYELYY